MLGSSIFTDQIYKSIGRIEYLYGGQTLIITERDDIEKIYDMLTKLELVEYKLNFRDMKSGYNILKLVVGGKFISVGILESDIMINGRYYKINENIVEGVKEVALKYKK